MWTIKEWYKWQTSGNACMVTNMYVFKMYLNNMAVFAENVGFIARWPIKHACEGSCKQWSIACWNDCCIVSNPTSWRSFILSGITFFSAQTGASVLSSKKLEMRSFFCEEFMRNINEVYLKERQEMFKFCRLLQSKFWFLTPPLLYLLCLWIAPWF